MASDNPNPSKANVRVIVRFRPSSSKHDGLSSHAHQKFFLHHTQQTLDFCPGSGTSSSQRVTPRHFTFDHVFGAEGSQSSVFDAVAKETVLDVLGGYNGTIFAYGQTGSGKTYTMFGDTSNPDLCGIIPRASRLLFQGMEALDDVEEVTIKCSFLEIYNETIRDLLSPQNKASLRIRETMAGEIYVEGLSEEYCSTPDEILDLLAFGQKFRTVSSTKMNEVSSRSHSLLILSVNQKLRDGSHRVGKLNLADLAGSERVERTNAKGQTLEEAKKINQSLSALGNCINALTDAKRSHIPFRDSTLTFLLRDSLGGNTKTTLLVNCSPEAVDGLETLSTLLFAQRAKKIKNIVSVNMRLSVKQLTELVEQLQAELRQSKQQTQLLKQMLAALLQGQPLVQDHQDLLSPSIEQALQDYMVSHSDEVQQHEDDHDDDPEEKEDRGQERKEAKEEVDASEDKQPGASPSSNHPIAQEDKEASSPSPSSTTSPADLILSSKAELVAQEEESRGQDHYEELEHTRARLEQALERVHHLEDELQCEKIRSRDEIIRLSMQKEMELTPSPPPPISMSPVAESSRSLSSSSASSSSSPSASSSTDLSSIPVPMPISALVAHVTDHPLALSDHSKEDSLNKELRQLRHRNKQLEDQVADMKKTWEAYLELMLENQKQERRSYLSSSSTGTVTQGSRPKVVKPVKRSFFSRALGLGNASNPQPTPTQPPDPPSVQMLSLSNYRALSLSIPPSPSSKTMANASSHAASPSPSSVSSRDGFSTTSHPQSQPASQLHLPTPSSCSASASSSSSSSSSSSFAPFCAALHQGWLYLLPPSRQSMHRSLSSSSTSSMSLQPAPTFFATHWCTLRPHALEIYETTHAPQSISPNQSVASLSSLWPRRNSTPGAVCQVILLHPTMRVTGTAFSEQQRYGIEISSGHSPSPSSEGSKAPAPLSSPTERVTWRLCALSESEQVRWLNVLTQAIRDLHPKTTNARTVISPSQSNKPPSTPSPNKQPSAPSPNKQPSAPSPNKPPSTPSPNKQPPISPCNTSSQANSTSTSPSSTNTTSETPTRRLSISAEQLPRLLKAAIEDIPHEYSNE